MVQEQRVVDAIKKFCTESDEFKKMFYEAPPVAKERLAIAFYFSTFKDQFQASDFDEYRNLREQIESEMNRDDLQYMIDHIGKPDSVQHYQELLEKLKQKDGSVQQNGKPNATNMQENAMQGAAV